MRTMLAVAALILLTACSRSLPAAPTATNAPDNGVTAAILLQEPTAGRIRPAALDFPAQDQSVRFRTQLEDYYRATPGRTPQLSYADLTGIMVWTQEYVRYRVGGCGHAEGVSRTLQALTAAVNQTAAPGLCSSVTTRFPDRPEANDFRNTLEAHYRDVMRRQPWQTYVDAEGDGIWSIEYLRYRTTGCDHDTAYDKVKQQLDTQGRIGAPADCSRSGGGTTITPPPPPPLPPSVTATNASFVMEQNGSATNTCAFSASSAVVTNCRLNGSSSTGAGSLNYSWSMTRFPSQGSSVTTTGSGPTVALNFSCTVGAQKNTQDRLRVTLTVTGSGGSNTTARDLTLALAGCGA